MFYKLREKLPNQMLKDISYAFRTTRHKAAVLWNELALSLSPAT